MSPDQIIVIAMIFKKMTLICLLLFFFIMIPSVDYRVHLLAGEFETYAGPMWSLRQPGGYQVKLSTWRKFGKRGWPQIVESCNPGV